MLVQGAWCFSARCWHVKVSGQVKGSCREEKVSEVGKTGRASTEARKLDVRRSMTV